jgi:LmbE family N-acetylglucosaminyl deacetylase
MSLTIDLETPARVLAVGAHPDDIEFGCGATLAKWADGGAQIVLCVCTDGAKGTWDADADTTALISRREAEQKDAAAVLGASGVEFLRYVDGELVDNVESRERVCRILREVRPDVVLGHDPWHPYRLHPDHREAGTLVIAGIVAARDPHFFPAQGLAPHRPRTLLCFEPARVNHVEVVADHVGRKAEALLAHRSQWQSTMGIAAHPDAQRAAFIARIHAEARAHGLRAGARAGEAFARIDDL